ncbi:PLP-dependent aminotransferase family protein [Pedobacter sp.]|jgi:GntR family transcriptional regulator/MocR family aminotransferase|uniref:MocR-like pyridoxine biosynthesis transcription factor PdxR n=1 Tax=Pedobacter sp. TaxID=1411316 RepID=UPI002CB0C6C4|nr:PLP-dependent aminotransferase family protein [Pedobacter sp.]HWW41400.1 PLP-dependent aminotransferase family protein [Pedobacter sp.]
MAKTAPEILMTFIKLEKTSRTPLYIQLYEEISRGILNGMLKSGDRMPATRLLAKEFGIARNCVIHAYEQLSIEGYICSQTGAGTYVTKIPDKPQKRTNNYRQQKIISISTNELPHAKFAMQDCNRESFIPFQASVPFLPDFPFKTWGKIAADIYRNIHQYYLGYDHGQGYLPLRTAISDYLRINRSINCGPEQIVVVNGSRQAIHLIAELLVQKNSQCWMEDPGYNGAKTALAKFGAEICPIPIQTKGIDLDYAITHYPNAKLAYITPSHQFPMGITMPLDERLKLLNYARKQKMVIIEDDYDSEFRYDGRPFAALKGIDTHGNVMYIGTFSKILFPALRIGYMVLPSQELAEKFTLIKAITDRQNPVIDQAILAEFIRDGHLNRHLRKMRLLYKKNQDDLIQLLKTYLGDKISISKVEAGMHFVLTFKNALHAEQIKLHGKQKGLTLYPIDHLSLQFHYPNSFLIGFTGFSFSQMEAGVKLMKQIIESELSFCQSSL